jgi:hypothetical protein
MRNPQLLRRLALGGLLLVLCPLQPQVLADAPAAQQGPHDGQHDFDFEFGRWKTHLRRLQHPLSGSGSWVELDGSSVVRKVWDGRGNLGELEVGNADGHIEGLSLRVYNPQARQWSIYWCNSRDGQLSTPMIGGFDGKGRGEFYGQDTYNNTAILVRFIFSDLGANSFRLEQAFSADGGKTWEANWIASFVREADGISPDFPMTKPLS